MTAGFERNRRGQAPASAVLDTSGAARAGVHPGGRGGGRPAGAAANAAGPSPTAGAPQVFPGFDGLRAIAALLVLLVHVGFSSGLTMTSSVGDYVARGEIGVEVFFLISGFLLYRPFAAAHLTGRSAPDAAGFYIRRFLRIIPLYWFALAVALVVLPEGRLHLDGVRGLVQTAFFTHGYQLETAIQGLTQAWTLNIEVAFYLFVPPMAWLLVRRRRSPEAQLKVELAALAAMFVISRVLHYVLVGIRTGWADGWNVWLPVWWDLFAMGMLLAVLSSWYERKGVVPGWARWRWFGGACWLIAAFCYWVASTRIDLPRSPMFTPDRSQDLGRHLFYGLFGFFLMLPAVFGPQNQGLVRRFLACRPLAFLGLISYGIYLWHTIVLDLVIERTGEFSAGLPFGQLLLVVFVGTCALSTVTYYLVERPFTTVARDLARRVRARGQRVDPAVPVGAGVPAARDGGDQDGAPAGTPAGTSAIPDTDPLRTMPLRIHRPRTARSGDLPATRVPVDSGPGAVAPWARGGDGERGDRRERRDAEPASDGPGPGRRAHLHSRRRDGTR